LPSARALRARPPQSAPAAVDAPPAPPKRPSTVRRSNRASRASSGELELNLIVDPDALATLMDSPPIAAHARKKGAVRFLKDTYYDTARGALKRAGVTLRVREARKRFVQLVKMAPSEPELPVRGKQWEFPVSSNAPDFQAMMPLMAMGLQDVLDR